MIIVTAALCVVAFGCGVWVGATLMDQEGRERRGQ